MYRTAIDLTGLQPQFRDDALTLLSNDPAHWYITSALRAHDEQAKLYAKYKAGGPLAAPPGESAHEFGLAVDVVLVIAESSLAGVASVRWSYNWMRPEWMRLKAKIWNHPRLHSLWKFGDWPHIERYQWRKFMHWNAQLVTQA